MTTLSNILVIPSVIRDIGISSILSLRLTSPLVKSSIDRHFRITMKNGIKRIIARPLSFRYDDVELEGGEIATLNPFKEMESMMRTRGQKRMRLTVEEDREVKRMKIVLDDREIVLEKKSEDLFQGISVTRQFSEEIFIYRFDKEIVKVRTRLAYITVSNGLSCIIWKNEDKDEDEEDEYEHRITRNEHQITDNMEKMLEYHINLQSRI